MLDPDLDPNPVFFLKYSGSGEFIDPHNWILVYNMIPQFNNNVFFISEIVFLMHFVPVPRRCITDAIIAALIVLC